MKTKLVTVSCHVWHGDYNHTETATGPDVETALAEIQFRPNSGYMPAAGSVQFNTVVQLLKLKGTAEHGWADYSATIKDAP